MNAATSWASTPLGTLPRGVFSQLCIFNLCPADYLHPARRADFVKLPLDDETWSSPRVRAHLSKLILERLGVGTCLETARTEWPLALLDGERLARLARHVAAVLLGARVRSCISRGDVLAWREWLTAPAHEFALTSANLLPSIPGVEARRDAESAEDLGFRWIGAATRGWPDPLARRMELKLPPQPASESESIPADMAGRLIKHILSIVEQSWCSSFVKIRG